MSRQPTSEPDPPNAVRTKSRTSRPRLTVTCLIALAWFHAAISSIPVAAARLRERQLAGDVLQPGPGRLGVERHLTTQQMRREAPEHAGGRR